MFCVCRWCCGGVPPFRLYHLSNSRSVATAWGEGDHAVLWRPATWLLSNGSYRLYCSSDLCTPRDLVLYLHVCGPGLSATPYCRLCLCGPGYLCEPQHLGAEGETYQCYLVYGVGLSELSFSPHW